MIDERQRRLMELAREGTHLFRASPEGEGWSSGHREIRSCGDAVTIHLRLQQGRILEAGYTGSGCALSLASAELVSEALAGKELPEAERFLREARSALEESAGLGAARLAGELEELAIVRDYPARKGCVLLALDAALEGIEASDMN